MGVLVLVAALLAAEPKVIGPREAVRLAARDITTLDGHDQCHQFYVWYPNPKAIEHAANSYAVNTAISHAETLIRPAILADGHLARWDKRLLLPDHKDRERFERIWEDVLPLTEPYTHQPGLARGKNGQLFLKIPCDSYIAVDGQTYKYKTVAIRREEQFAEHTGLQDMLFLHALTDSNLPIVRHDWLENIVLTTLKVGNTQGQYYDLRGFRGLNQEQILKLFGANEADTEKLGGDSRSAIFHSKVTDRQRRMDAFFGTGVRPTAGVPLITISHDIALEDTEPEQDPILNILEFKDTAREAIIVQKNGMLAGILWNGQGVLQDAVPQNVARDKNVAHPSPDILVPIISCITCHGPEDGFIPHGNDIRDLFLQRRRLPLGKPANIEDDLTVKRGRFKALDIAYGKYKGDLNPIYMMARAMHSAAVKEATGMGVTEVCAQLDRSRNAYLFGRIDNRQALYELGLDIEPEGDTAEDQERYMAAAMAKAVPPLEGDDSTRYLEDGRILALLHPERKTLSRAQFELIYPDLANRLYQATQGQELENVK